MAQRPLLPEMDRGFALELRKRLSAIAPGGAETPRHSAAARQTAAATQHEGRMKAALYTRAAMRESLALLPRPAIGRLIRRGERADILPIEPCQLPYVQEVVGQPRSEQVAGRQSAARMLITALPVRRG